MNIQIVPLIPSSFSSELQLNSQSLEQCSTGIIPSRLALTEPVKAAIESVLFNFTAVSDHIAFLIQGRLQKLIGNKFG